MTAKNSIFVGNDKNEKNYQKRLSEKVNSARKLKFHTED